MICKGCGANRGSPLWRTNADVNDGWFELQRRAFTGNFEGTIVTTDAAIFCSTNCLLRYIGEARDAA